MTTFEPTPPPSAASMDQDIVSARYFRASPEAMFDAFLDPRILERWWGPAGFTNRFEEFDPRPGGVWRFAMRGPDGAEYRMLKEFEEITPGERIVLRHIDPVHGFRMTITFDAESGGTRLTWRMRFDSAEEAERVRSPILAANEENFDRLASQLAVGEDSARTAPGSGPL